MKYIIGADEVGTGAWAGPLVVCAAAAPLSWSGPEGLNDSKELDAVERVALYPELITIPFSLMSVDSTVIDKLGLKEALVRAFTSALSVMAASFPDAEIIVDGTATIPQFPKARCIPRADGTYPVVMAASIIAKVNRDFVMREFHKQYPYYGWDTGVGYHSKKQNDGLKKHGVSPLHRASYEPIKKLLENKT